MSEKIILIIFGIILLIGFSYLVFQIILGNWGFVSDEELVLDSTNCAYIINDSEVQLINGYLEQEIEPGSASKIITRYLGEEVVGDFNQDGLFDKAFFLAQETGGSGVFYYVAVALNSIQGECKGTNAIFIGDRIAPQLIKFEGEKIIVNYLDRKEEEPMTALPKIESSKSFQVKDNKLVEIIK